MDDVEDIDFDAEADVDPEEDEDADADDEPDVQTDAEASDTVSDDSHDSDEDDEDEDAPSSPFPADVAPESSPPDEQPSKVVSPSPVARKRSLSPARIRRKGLISNRTGPFTVEAVCALPHPCPTHALASSYCMTHLVTGSEDGYIRDYDVFTALNGKTFLSAPQRHHASVVEGLMKAGQLRCWWENPAGLPHSQSGEHSMDEDLVLSPVYSLAMHSDALWSLAGTDTGHINLFTVRHDPGRLCHVFKKESHQGPVSALSIDHHEKAFYSAGWDGEAKYWDLNTGSRIRTFTSHGAQLTGIAVRPLGAVYADSGSPTTTNWQDSDAENSTESAAAVDADAKSDGSFDPLFDDPEAEGDSPNPSSNNKINIQQDLPSNGAGAPKGAPPLLNPSRYRDFSADLLFTSAIDGQIMLWDKRVDSPGKGVGRLWMNEKTPPWCLSACWNSDGSQIFAGRRNGTVDIYDLRQIGRSGPKSAPRLLKTIRNPSSSGVVSCVVAFPDSNYLACASIDNIRLWNVSEANESESGRRGGVQFKIIPGHHGGYISQMIVDAAGRFLVSASSNRGWHGESTKTVFLHDIKITK